MCALYQKTNLHKLIIGCMVALVFLMSFVPQLVLAQSVPNSAVEFAPGPSTGGAGFVLPGNSSGAGAGTGDPTTFVDGPTTGASDLPGGAAEANAAQAAAAQADSTTAGKELAYANRWIYGFLTTIGSIFTWFGGLMLDTSINVFVVGMGTRLLNANFGYTVDELWKVIRDVFNILFIFVLIYIGIRTILNSDDSGVKKQLGMLIVAALLINFSLLITKSIIDFSNIAAIQIYNKISTTGSDPLSATLANVTGEASSGGGGGKSVSSIFMQHFNLASYANTDSVRISVETNGFFSWKVVSFGFLMMAMMIIAGFAFLSGAILMLYRFIALIFYMILSPAMFLGWIYPGFESYSKQWWKGFISNAFVAPAYLFVIYLATRMVAGMPTQSGMNFGRAFENAEGTFAVFTYFFVMCGFLFAATQVATKMGAAGADMTAKIGGYGLKAAGAATFGAAGVAGRNVFGGIANRLSEQDYLKDAASKKGLKGTLARATLKSSRVVADSNFDARKSLGLNKLKVNGTDVSLGEGRKGGYASINSEIEKKEKAFAKSLDEIGDNDPKVIELGAKIESQKHAVRLATAERDAIRLRDQKAGESDESYGEYVNGYKSARAEAQAKIDTEKDSLTSLEAAKNQEKFRRQIGTAGDTEAAGKLSEEMKKKKDVLKELNETLKDKTKSKEQRKVAAEKKSALNDEIKKLNRKIKEKVGTLGYSGVLETSSNLSSGIYGRWKTQDKEAGENIRKEYEKKAKQSKEDKNTETLASAVKDSAKKD